MQKTQLMGRSMGLKFRFGDLLYMIEALCWSRDNASNEDISLCFAGSIVAIRSLIFACICIFSLHQLRMLSFLLETEQRLRISMQIVGYSVGQQHLVIT